MRREVFSAYFDVLEEFVGLVATGGCRVSIFVICGFYGIDGFVVLAMTSSFDLR